MQEGTQITGLPLVMNRFSAGLLFIGIATVAAGCQGGGGGLGNVLNPASRSQPVEASSDAVRESELRAYCPSIALREGTAFYTTYGGNAHGDPQKVIYQAAITDVTRTCRYGQGVGTITIAAAGKVVPGPLGKAGSITMPIRVVIMRGEEVALSELYNYQVAVADTSGATQFIFNQPDIVVPGGIDRSVRVMIGYDEGPQN